MPIRYRTHDLFVKEDFTDEEISRGNVLAVAVITENESVCKRCGDHGRQLESVCQKSVEYTRLSIRDREFEDNLRTELTDQMNQTEETK